MLKPNLTSEAFKSQKTLTGKQFRTGPLGEALHDTYTDIDAAFTAADRGVLMSPVSNTTDDSTTNAGTLYGSTAAKEYNFEFKNGTNGKNQGAVFLTTHKLLVTDVMVINTDSTSGTSLTLRIASQASASVDGTSKIPDDTPTYLVGTNGAGADIKSAANVIVRPTGLANNTIAANQYVHVVVDPGATLTNGTNIIIKAYQIA